MNPDFTSKISYWKNDLYSDKGQFCRLNELTFMIFKGNFIAYEPDGSMTFSENESLTGPLEEPWYQITVEQWNECFNEYKNYNQPKK